MDNSENKESVNGLETNAENTKTPRKKAIVSVPRELQPPMGITVNEQGVPQLRKLDLSMVKPDFAVLVFGVRRTGKSFFTRWMLYHLRKMIPWILVMTETKMNGFWQEFVEERFVHEDFNVAVLAKLLKIQKDAIIKQQKNQDAYEEVNLAKAFALDDCIASKDLKYSKDIEKCFVLGRHLKMFIVLLTQHTKAINPTIRCNTDLTVMLKMNALQQRKSLAEDYLGFLNTDAAMKLLDVYTHDRRALCVFNTGTSNDPWDNVFWAKAEEPPDFTLGCPELEMFKHDTI